MHDLSLEGPASRCPPNGVSASPWRLTGRVIGGRYRIEWLIGRGAMGCVYRARHVELGRSCAVKLIERAEQDALLVEWEEAKRRLRLEALALSLLDHPNIVQVFDFGREPREELLYLVTEHIGGRDLSAEIAGVSRLGIARVCAIVRQVCAALEHAHARGVVHRDLKPENLRIFRRTDGLGRVVEQVKLLDFGTALLPCEDERETDTCFVVGTPAYMSPEQAAGEPIDGRSDIYACGVLLFELCTGRPPFDGPNALSVAKAQLIEPPPRPRALCPDIPPALEEIILHCLEKERSARPPSARALADALARVREHRRERIAHPRSGTAPARALDKTGDTSTHGANTRKGVCSIVEGVMSIVLWILFGLVVGVIAKLLTPGREPGGFILTALLGIAGALVGGFVGRALGLYPSYQSTGGFFMSILGAVIILAIYNAIVSRRRTKL